MTEPTHPGDASVRDDWPAAYTGLDWVARWMAERGYTDAEIQYVVGPPAVAARPADPGPADKPALALVGTDQPVWTVPLPVTDAGPAADGEEQATA